MAAAGIRLPQDHPRACGKHNLNQPKSRIPQGSPPRLRETLQRLRKRHLPLGITPAPAGNTGPCRGVRWPHRDHPRACGKHRIPTTTKATKQGSPPRLRETQPQVLGVLALVGITPAPAGNTSSNPACQRLERDHPRACGKHVWEEGREVFRQGSPPRLRETHEENEGKNQRDGITPAPAGNTNLGP